MATAFCSSSTACITVPFLLGNLSFEVKASRLPRTCK